MPDTSCDICAQPLGAGAHEGVCRSCLAAGASWAHRHLVRLWNRGLGRSEISAELGYGPETVTTLVLRLRNRGDGVDVRHSKRPRTPVA